MVAHTFIYNYYPMYNKKIQKPEVITWRRFAGHGYSAFASLHRQVRIGVLSVATLAVAAKAEARLSSAPAIDAEEEQTEEAKSIDEVTVSGTMAPLTQLQSARIVSVLQRQDIEQAGVQSINDLFKLVTGVDVRQRGGFGIQTDISIDGGIFDQITILLNGVNISNPHTGHLAADFPVSVSDIERIEVLEGAASRIYGGQSFGGAINIVTRKEEHTTIEAGAQGGSYGTFDADARVGLTLGHTSHRLSGGGGRSDGGTLNSDWHKGQLYYQGDFNNQKLTLDWQFGFSKKSYGANTFYSAAYPDQYERNERYLVSVKGETKGKFHFTPQVYWNRTYDNFELVRGTTFGENFHQADVYGIKAGGYFNWWGGKTALGAELRQEGILSTNLGRDLAPEQYVDARHGGEAQYTRQDDRTSISYNLEHNILLSRWTISAGVMANMTTSVDHKYRFYPGVDISYRPAAGWKLYASYNKGFRLPSFTELYYKSPTHDGNQGLKPEHNRSLQVGVQYATSGFQGTLRGFYHRGNQMIDWVMYTADDTYHSAAFDLDNMGVQAEGRLSFPELFHKNTWVRNLSVGYTYIHQKRHDDVQIYKSNYAMEYLRHKFVASLHHRIWDRLSATWSVRWQDRMGSYVQYSGTYVDTATGYLRGQTTGELVSYSPYATLDLKLQWTADHYQVFVQGTNITNHKYYDLGNVQQPGIWVMAGVRVKF